MKALRIIGAGGHGRVVADIAEQLGYSDIAFLDERFPELSSSGVWKVVGKAVGTILEEHALAIGDNRKRLSLVEQLDVLPISLVHPSAVVSPHARIGPGSVICAGAIVGPFAKLGRACIINTGASVDHDCELSDAVHVSPGAHLAGSVSVGKCTWIGIGATVRQNITIGKDAIVGAGAAVIDNVHDSARVGGVPAKEF